ncbi:HPr family phosphocarrier protein [Collinsella sp. zg1085]|uniref:HPr family phosphocarrier protein n=1 Tax=Collinsella sp. zg1085 TaxID=2844380 RepID=UPI001C0BD9CA|nr:HPr family phosphocarrier protein [Collinsella sp. zg1085]QWT18192.1 HPr family phosphocarrier protein [Collinsella sp. zg1085]
MVSDKATLVNPQGLHMRPAGLFASTMGKYASDVTIVTPEKEVNGKSPMGLMAAGIPCGTEIEVRCDGPDEQEALVAAIELIKSGLGE